MQDKLFAERSRKWKAEGELTAFNLACVAEALHDKILQSIADYKKKIKKK